METTAAALEGQKLDICEVGASPFVRRIRREKVKVFAVTLYEINKALGITDLQEKPC
jgi:hypothetical protein